MNDEVQEELNERVTTHTMKEEKDHTKNNNKRKIKVHAKLETRQKLTRTSKTSKKKQ